MIIVSVAYRSTNFPDAAIFCAAGRKPDGFSIDIYDPDQRGNSWHCASEWEAARIKRGLKRIGLFPYENPQVPECSPAPTAQAPNS